jgi:hypothetical protein
MYRYLLILTVICFLSGVNAYAQTEQSGYILTKLGRDTIAVEKFSADVHGLQGTSIVRAPRTMVREYSATFNAEGNLEHFHVTYQPYGGTTVNERDFLYSNDSVHVTVKQDTAVTRFAVGTQERPFPLFIDLFGGWQVALQRAVGANRKQFSVLSGKRILRYSIEGKSPGTLELVEINHGFGPFHVDVGRDGQLEKFDMTETTDKFLAERTSSMDIMTMAKEFAARDRAGSALGVLSPRDTIRAEINGTHLVLDYSRPSVRGRTIFGHVVPWDSVWRTGANAATQLTSDKEIQFGSSVVPPGTYSLFTIPAAKGWLLIINRQHGQWGTEYNQSMDLARLPLELKHSEDLIERFTFEIAPQGTHGVLRFKWEHTEASIPFTVR